MDHLKVEEGGRVDIVYVFCLKEEGKCKSICAFTH